MLRHSLFSRSTQRTFAGISGLATTPLLLDHLSNLIRSSSTLVNISCRLCLLEYPNYCWERKITKITIEIELSCDIYAHLVDASTIFPSAPLSHGKPIENSSTKPYIQQNSLSHTYHFVLFQTQIQRICTKNTFI